MRKYRPRKYFTTGELKLMQKLADENKSQSQVAQILNRDHRTIYQAARRYKIKFSAPPGPKKIPPVTRFDDLRIMK